MAITKGKEGEGGTGGEGEGGESKPAFTEAQRAELNTIVGGAVAGHLKSGKVAASIGEMVKNVVGEAIGAALKDFKPPAPTEEEEEARAAKGKAKEPSEAEKRLAALEREHKKLQEQVKQREEALAAETAKSKAAKERGALYEALVAGKVPAPQAKALAAYLQTEQKRIKSVDNGQGGIDILFTVANSGGYTEDKPIAEGVLDFLKTDEGKAWLPPVQATGTGGQRGQGFQGGAGGAGGQGGAGQGQNGQPGKMTKEQAAAILDQAYGAGGGG